VVRAGQQRRLNLHALDLLADWVEPEAPGMEK
jgi:hypothetical protein